MSGGVLPDGTRLQAARAPLCALCRGRVSKRHLCYGCDHYVCGECDKLQVIGGEHPLAAHLGAIRKARGKMTALNLPQRPRRRAGLAAIKPGGTD